MNAKSTNNTTRQIAEKIRARRIGLGLSQEKLAETLGITFQQVQKYEKGLNRISACRLVELAAALKCQASDLLPEEGAAPAPAAVMPANVQRLALRIAALPPSRRGLVVTQTNSLCSVVEGTADVAALEAAE